MKNQSTTLLVIISFLIVISSCKEKTVVEADTKTENWIQLFNGKDLTGWDIKISGSPMNDNFLNTFVVEDEMIKVNYEEYDTFIGYFGHLYYEKPYSHYKLRLEYRIVGEPTPGSPSYAFANSGVMLHSQSAADQELN